MVEVGSRLSPSTPHPPSPPDNEDKDLPATAARSVNAEKEQASEDRFKKTLTMQEIKEEERVMRKSIAEAAFQLEYDSWGRMRQLAWRSLNNTYFDSIMGLVIVFNVVLMLVEADKRGGCYPEACESMSITNINRGLLAVYTIESVVRGFADRCKFWSSKWNILDFTIVSIGWGDEALALVLGGGNGSLGQLIPMLRVLRVARLLRAVKWIKLYPELYIMIRGFFGAMKAMFWGLVLIIILITFWSLIAVELINPINKDMLARVEVELGRESVDEFCEVAFASIFNCAVVLFQTLVAGDSWGRCIIPIIHQNQLVGAPFFTMALVSVSLGFMNLILAVIVDNATSSRDADREDAMKRRKEEEANALKQWREVIKQIDEDGSGSISKQELLGAFEIPDVRNTLEYMGLDHMDLNAIFDVLDIDKSGELDYDEFIASFLKAQGQDLRMYLMMQRIQVDSLSLKMEKLMVKVEKDIADHFAWSQGMASAETRMTHEASVLKEMEQHVVEYQDGANLSRRSSPAGGLELPLGRGESSGAGRAAPGSAAPGSAGGGWLSAEPDFRDLSRQIEEQFSSLALSVQSNTSTIARHTKVLESVVTDQVKATL